MREGDAEPAAQQVAHRRGRRIAQGLAERTLVAVGIFQEEGAAWRGISEGRLPQAQLVGALGEEAAAQRRARGEPEVLHAAPCDRGALLRIDDPLRDELAQQLARGAGRGAELRGQHGGIVDGGEPPRGLRGTVMQRREVPGAEEPALRGGDQLRAGRWGPFDAEAGRAIRRGELLAREIRLLVPDRGENPQVGTDGQDRRGAHAGILALADDVVAHGQQVRFGAPRKPGGTVRVADAAAQVESVGARERIVGGFEAGGGDRRLPESVAAERAARGRRDLHGACLDLVQVPAELAGRARRAERRAVVLLDGRAAVEKQHALDQLVPARRIEEAAGRVEARLPGVLETIPARVDVRPRAGPRVQEAHGGNDLRDPALAGPRLGDQGDVVGPGLAQLDSGRETRRLGARRGAGRGRCRQCRAQGAPVKPAGGRNRHIRIHSRSCPAPSRVRR
jgi:hypothetical protein